MLKRALLLAALATTLSGCSWFSGWFGSDKPAAKPAELSEFKASASLVRQWDANVGSAGPYEFSPATDGQAVYAAGRDGKVVKLDLASGRELWRIDVGQVISAGVGVGEGLVLVGTPKGELLAYKAADGAAAWKARLSGEILVPPVAAGGVVAARGNDGKIALFEANDGKQRWANSRALPALTLREQGYLALGGGVLYAGNAGGKLNALSLVNGAPLWETNIALPRGSTELERIADVVGPLAMDERQICAAAYQGRIACVDRATGNGTWARELSSLRGVDMDARYVFAGDDHGALFAYERARGGNSWKQDKLRGRGLSSPAAIAERYVAVGDYQGQVHLINAEDGAFAARAATDGSPIKSAMIPLKSGLVVQTTNGGVYALKIQ
ncbi:MAG: outer membrane protein assembly factor BamB [Gallionellaceae bacterium]|nr:outer membrane protein assembly factor BamB [Gallionellaceae bacterium]